MNLLRRNVVLRGEEITVDKGPVAKELKDYATETPDIRREGKRYSWLEEGFRRT